MNKCPECGQTIPPLDSRIPGEKEKASAALAQVPESVRGFYTAHYNINAYDGPVGLFRGLACRVCNKWREYGHDPDCPVKQLEAAACQRATISVRPPCPVCKLPSLIGEMKQREQGYSGYATRCQNPFCLAIVFLDPQWRIIGAERHYGPDGQVC